MNTFRKLRRVFCVVSSVFVCVCVRACVCVCVVWCHWDSEGGGEGGIIWLWVAQCHWRRVCVCVWGGDGGKGELYNATEIVCGYGLFTRPVMGCLLGLAGKEYYDCQYSYVYTCAHSKRGGAYILPPKKPLKGSGLTLHCSTRIWCIHFPDVAFAGDIFFFEVSPLAT